MSPTRHPMGPSGGRVASSTSTTRAGISSRALVMRFQQADPNGKLNGPWGFSHCLRELRSRRATTCSSAISAMPQEPQQQRHDQRLRSPHDRAPPGPAVGRSRVIRSPSPASGPSISGPAWRGLDQGSLLHRRDQWSNRWPLRLVATVPEPASVVHAVFAILGGSIVYAYRRRRPRNVAR